MKNNSFKRLPGKRLLSLSMLLVLLASGLWLFSGSRTEAKPDENYPQMRNAKARVVAPDEDRALNKEETMAVGGIKTLHSFAGSPKDGALPYDSLILSGSTLYGMTYEGGANNKGTIFKIQTNGSGYTLLHSFVGCDADGQYPLHPLIISGSTLYGTTYEGGANNKGTIFKIQTNGSGYTLLHSFVGGAADGAYPTGSLVSSGSTLYGLTENGGAVDRGLLFKIQMDGTGFTILHEFTPIYDFEGCPFESPILSGSTIYGRLWDGLIFKIQTDGSGYSTFIGGSYYPVGSLALSGATLYAMTKSDYPYDPLGIIYKIQTDGSGYTRLYSFSGIEPSGSPCISGSTIYGMVAPNNYHRGASGSLFKIKTDGSGFVTIHSFKGGRTNGYNPQGSPIISGTTIYGMTHEGGAIGYGVIFSLPLSNYIAVTSPKGGEKWMVGTAHNITWTYPETKAKVNIDYTTNDGRDWTSVITNTTNDGSYTWTVPNTLSANCLIRISDTNNAAINDVSDAMFSILMNIDLLAERHEVRAFSILRQYGQIHFLGGNPNIPVAEYRIMRRKGTADFALLKAVALSELHDNQFQMQDKYLEKNTQYTYKVEAYDAAGQWQLIGISIEKTI